MAGCQLHQEPVPKHCGEVFPVDLRLKLLAKEQSAIWVGDP